MPTSLGEQTPPREVTTLSTNTLKDRTQHGTSFEYHIIDISGLKAFFVAKIYVRLDINKLMKTITSQMSGTIKKPTTIFYNAL